MVVWLQFACIYPSCDAASHCSTQSMHKVSECQPMYSELSHAPHAVVLVNVRHRIL